MIKNLLGKYGDGLMICAAGVSLIGIMMGPIHAYENRIAPTPEETSLIRCVSELETNVRTNEITRGLYERGGIDPEEISRIKKHLELDSQKLEILQSSPEYQRVKRKIKRTIWQELFLSAGFFTGVALGISGVGLTLFKYVKRN